MSTTQPARTANDVANLFFVQKLSDTKASVERWQREFTAALSEGNLSSAGLTALFLYDTCVDGKIDTVISRRQGVWLYKMLAREKRQNKRTPHTVIYQGRSLGSWTYQEATSRDPCERMTFRVDPAFVRDYTGVDPTLLERVKCFIQQEDCEKRSKQGEISNQSLLECYQAVC